MTTEQHTCEVIEQLVEALDHCMGAITERGLNGSPDQAEKWGLQLPLERAYAALAAGQQALEQTSAVPVVRQMVEALERKLPGGKQTDDFESSRIGDYNQGWNDYRKAVKKMFKNINMNSSENSNPDAYLYSLEYGEKVVDTKVSIHQLNYPFGVAGADYLVRNDDGVSYVRQTKLYAALSRAQATEPAPSPEVLQALTDPESQPNQFGVVFGMHGPRMFFAIGNQSFDLAYEPDEPEEFEFMKRMLCSAFSTFTPDVKTAPASSTAGEAVHKYNLELPDGDKRDARVWFSARTINNGVSTHDLCITVRDSATPSQVEPAPTGCAHCQNPLYAGTKCKNCGRVSEVAPSTFNSCDFEGTETMPAPSTAGERDNKTEMLAKLTAWLDGLGGSIHTYSLRGIALDGFEKGWDAARSQPTTEESLVVAGAQPVREPLTPDTHYQEWKHGCDSMCTNITLWIYRCPHCGKPRPVVEAAHAIPSAARSQPTTEESLVVAGAQPVREPLTLEELELCRQWFNSVQDTNGGYFGNADYVLAEKLYGILKIRCPNSITSVVGGITKKGGES